MDAIAMYVRLNQCVCVIGFLLLVWAAQPVSGAERHGRQIEFSKPRAQVATTNLADPDAQKLQEVLLRQRIGPETPRVAEVPDSAPAPAHLIPAPVYPSAPPPTQIRRLKELLDRRRNWVYLTLEEIGIGWETEEKLGLSRPEEVSGQKEKPSVLERFFQRLQRQTGLETSEPVADSAPEFDSLSSVRSQQPDSPAAQRVRETEESLHRLFTSQPGAVFWGRSGDKGFSVDWQTHVGFSSVSSEPDLARKARLDEFRQLIDPQATVKQSQISAGTPVPTGVPAGRNRVVSSWSTPESPAVPSVPTGPDMRGSFGVTPLPGVGTPSAGQPANLPTRTRELPQIPQPLAAPPQRKF